MRPDSRVPSSSWWTSVHPSSSDLKISRFYDQVRVDYAAEEEITPLDPEFLSFFNVNSPPDLDRALALVAQGR